MTGHKKYIQFLGKMVWYPLNSCQGKDAGILYRINYTLIKTQALHVIQVLDRKNYFQSC